ncbi:hypothetical protein EDD18DRAFT_1084594, partial [Armillaria luteobubalina]
PWHIWDLCANHVAPWWVVKNFRGVWAISHVWVADNDLKYKMTPINRYEWPMPMLKNSNLDHIRIEMLNLSMEYVWLDVLCLRQKGQEWDHREAMRKEEWKVDLPIIGWVYHAVGDVACYLSGLGLPLSFEDLHCFGDDQCWFNQSWTLQETLHSVEIAGQTHSMADISNKRGYKMLNMLFDRLEYFSYIQQWTEQGERVLYFLEEMKRWKSSNPVDKVVGLIFLLDLKHIPIYDAGQSEDDAWAELMNITDNKICVVFLFLYPKLNGNRSWRPSWEQLMTERSPELPCMFCNFDHVPNVSWTTEDGNSYDGPHMDAYIVQGLADGTDEL